MHVIELSLERIDVYGLLLVYDALDQLLLLISQASLFRCNDERLLGLFLISFVLQFFHVHHVYVFQSIVLARLLHSFSVLRQVVS